MFADARRFGSARDRAAAIAWIAGIASALSYGLTPTAAAFGYAGGVSPAVLVCLRSGLGAVLLLAAAVATGRLQGVSWRPVLGLTCLCGPLFGIQLLCFFAAVRVTGAQVAVVIVHIYPLFVLSLLWLRTRKIAHRGQIALALAMTAGVAFVGGTGSTAVAAIGVVLALASAVGYALYLVLGERWIHQVSALTAGGLASLGAGLTAGAFALVGGESWSFAASGWMSIVVQGLLLMPIGIGGSFLAVRKLGAAAVSLLGLLEPVVGVLAAQLFLGERLSVLQWMGMLVVVSASALLPLTQSRPRNGSAPVTELVEGSTARVGSTVDETETRLPAAKVSEIRE